MQFNQLKKLCTQKKQEKTCPYCGQSSQTVFVHGHEQCLFCKINIEPCCQGETQGAVLTGSETKNNGVLQN